MTQVGAQGLLAFVYSAMICKVQDPCPHSAAPYNALQRERIHPHHYGLGRAHPAVKAPRVSYSRTSAGHRPNKWQPSHVAKNDTSTI
jgi:hypothetical protein